MSKNSDLDAILLMGFGGPTTRDEVRPFLAGILAGRPVPEEHYEEIGRRYDKIGGHSPYNENTFSQAKALRAELVGRGIDIPVRAGMRVWKPYIADVLNEIAQSGARRIFGFILAPHRCAVSWEAYQDAVQKGQAALGPQAPKVEYPEPWHTNPKFIEAVAERTAQAIARLDASDRRQVEVIFTAHSVPIPIAKASRYAEEVTESSRMVAERLGCGSWSVAFQSRSGKPSDPWLEPDIGDALRKLGAGPAVVVPVGFVCDHVEVLYDLDIKAKGVAREAGGRMERAGTVGDHPAFIGMIADMVADRLGH